MPVVRATTSGIAVQDADRTHGAAQDIGQEGGVDTVDRARQAARPPTTASVVTRPMPGQMTGQADDVASLPRGFFIG